MENERESSLGSKGMPGLHRDSLDQFYTRPDVADACVTVLKAFAPRDVPWIEPSAGGGAFLNWVPEAIGYDLAPTDSRIQTADFLQTDIPSGCVVFGNPPFGRQSSLAKRFIRHAATRADWIGFVLPRSFVKPSMQSAFPPVFHLLYTLELPENAFVVEGQPYHVPCVFQVWRRMSTPRPTEPPVTPKGFTFVQKADRYTLAFRRVGVYAGRCCLPADALSEQSHYFVKLEDESLREPILTASLTYPFPTNTVGPRSLSKGEATRFLQTMTDPTP